MWLSRGTSILRRNSRLQSPKVGEDLERSRKKEYQDTMGRASQQEVSSRG